MDQMEKQFIEKYPKVNLDKFRREYGESPDGRVDGVYEYNSKEAAVGFGLNKFHL